MDQKEFEIVSIIASRKAEFYLKTRDKLLASLLPSIDKKDVARALLAFHKQRREGFQYNYSRTANFRFDSG